LAVGVDNDAIHQFSQGVRPLTVTVINPTLEFIPQASELNLELRQRTVVEYDSLDFVRNAVEFLL
jgi:hypothetical protein